MVPAFAASATRYTLDVATSVTSVTVTARAQDAGATVSINSQTTTSRSVTLGAAGTSTSILIDVVAPNGNEKTYTVVVNRAAPTPPPTITTTTLLLSGAVGITYSDQVQATGGIENLTWSISVGFLPPGLNIDQGTGVISGTPDTAGSFDFTVQATDTFPQSDTRNLSITISP